MDLKQRIKKAYEHYLVSAFNLSKTIELINSIEAETKTSRLLVDMVDDAEAFLKRHPEKDMAKILRGMTMGIGESNIREDSIKDALFKMHDALGANYTTFSDVMATLDDMRIDFRPGAKEKTVMDMFKNKNLDTSTTIDPIAFWMNKSRDCLTVLDAVRLYLDANANQFAGADILKNRILVLANKGKWK